MTSGRNDRGGMDLEKGINVKAEEHGQLPCRLHFMEELTRYSGGNVTWKLPTKFVIPDQMKSCNPRAYIPQSGLSLGLNRRMLKETDESKMMTRLKAKWAIAYLRMRHTRRISYGPEATPDTPPDTPLTDTSETDPPTRPVDIATEWDSPFEIVKEWEDFVESLEIQVPEELACYELGFRYDQNVHESQVKSVLATDALFVVLFLLHQAGELPGDDFPELAADPQFKFRSHKFWNDLFLLENQIPWRVVQAVVNDCTDGVDLQWKKALHAALKAMFNKLFRLSDNAYFHLSDKQNVTFVDHLEVSFNNSDWRPSHLLDYLLAFICSEPTDWAKTWKVSSTSEHGGPAYSRIERSSCRSCQVPSLGLGLNSSREMLIDLFLGPTVPGKDKQQVATRRILEELDKCLPPVRDTSSGGRHSAGAAILQAENEKERLLEQAGKAALGRGREVGDLQVPHGRWLLTDMLIDPDDSLSRLFGFLPARVTLFLLRLAIAVLIAVTWIWIILRNAVTWIIYRCFVHPIGSLVRGFLSQPVGAPLDFIETLIPFDFIAQGRGRKRWKLVRFDFAATATTHEDDGVRYFDLLGVATMEWLERFVLFLSVAIFTKQVLIKALSNLGGHEIEKSREGRCAPILAYFEERAAVMKRLHQELHPSHPVHALLKLLFPDEYWKKLSETKDWAPMVQVLLEAVAARPPVDPNFAKAIVRSLPNAFKKLRKANGWPVVFLNPEDPDACLEDEDRHVDSAKTLVAAGVKLGRCNNLHQVDMEPASRVWFTPRACLRLPQLRMHEGTESLLRNLAAWELIKSDGKDMPLASYIKLMDNLIDTEEDVVLMKEAKVIDHHMASDKAVADLWNELSEGLLFRPSDRWARVLSKVNQERNRYCGKSLAELLHTYFSSPWSFIALVAASLLLLLTIAQTVLSVMSYDHS